jgi:hypothetical protein
MGAATFVTAGVFAALAVLVLPVVAAAGWVTIASVVLTCRLQG